MIELHEIEIEVVSGGLNMFTMAITVLNYGLEFFTGFADGVSDATAASRQ